MIKINRLKHKLTCTHIWVRPYQIDPNQHDWHWIHPTTRAQNQTQTKKNKTFLSVVACQMKKKKLQPKKKKNNSNSYNLIDNHLSKYNLPLRCFVGTKHRLLVSRVFWLGPNQSTTLHPLLARIEYNRM
jgi:hypothetical protein